MTVSALSHLDALIDPADGATLTAGMVELNSPG